MTSFISACLPLNEKHLPGILSTSAQISSQRSSGGVGKTLDLTSAPLSSGSTPGKDENIYQENGSPGTFQRFWKGPHRDEASGMCRGSPGLGLQAGSFSRGVFRTKGSKGEFQSWLQQLDGNLGFQKEPPQEAISFWQGTKCVLLCEHRHQGAGSCSVAPY